MTPQGKCPEFSAFLSQVAATLGTQTPIKRLVPWWDNRPRVSSLTERGNLAKAFLMASVRGQLVRQTAPLREGLVLEEVPGVRP